MLGRPDPARLPEEERVAFVGALCAMAAADGAPSDEETLEILARVELADLGADAARRACDHLLSPPPIAACAALATLPARVREEVAAQMLGVAVSDRDLVPAEVEALGRAREILGLGERSVARVTRRAAHERWEREHGLARADALDNLRNLAVIGAGFGAPVAAILWLGARAADGGAALAAGVEALGLGYGLGAGIVAAMALSMLASSGTSLLTLRGRRADRLRRDLALRSRRLPASLAVLVAHLGARVQSGPRMGSVALEQRWQLYRKTLARLTADR